MEERKIVVPGEIITKGDDFLPGDGTRREQEEIVSSRYGLVDLSDRMVRVIPLSGGYAPRRGNTIIGQVVNITFRGWVIDFDGHFNGFLPLTEVPRFINKGELRDYLDFGDVICAKIVGSDDTSLDLSIKLRGFGKIEGGQLMRVNPNKVPRIIGKEGSMVNLIKSATDTSIEVGQNGIVWLYGKKIEDELKAKRVIEFICENSFISGLTEKVEDYLKSLEK
jgi:exosome complex component RRP4